MNASGADWKNFLKELHKFGTFEDYWAIINTIEPASRLQKGCRYYIFKNEKEKQIQPLWEDEANLGGYEIFGDYPNQEEGKRGPAKSNVKSQEDWINLTISILGNIFKHVEYINGVEFNCRGPRNKVGIWTRKIEDETIFNEIKAELQSVLVNCSSIGHSIIELKEDNPK
ncbi:Eukaryotic initiation factor 4E family protein [Histomonas meleagridis]|uniref:Eukaryotic initiation factor 4E family protein n=1 Tax=Histomonas meleagridis TaxID=135588 RepID=UPI00355992F7|nr:Eukaryotic initiation factor 4E family protein [Histomonas meleagridis]KAH0803407.1 Eukaryotic initiation factor 4E family protein [Histomonas meleagridis]